MLDRKTREFYETDYHFEEDARVFDIGRKTRYFRGVSVPRGARVLDIGCGAGVNLCHWSGMSTRLAGIDLSLRALRVARGLLPGGAFALADGQALPFPDQVFDAVTALGVIEHFPDPRIGLAESFRVLRPGGRAILVFPNSYGSAGRWLRYSGTEQAQEMLLTRRGWIDLIRSVGYEIDEIGRDTGPRILKNRRPLKILARLLLHATRFLPPTLAYQFVFRVHRPPAPSPSR